MRFEDDERQLLSRWLDAEATAVEVQAAEALLARSPEARQWVEEVRGLQRLFADVPVPRSLPARGWAPRRFFVPAVASLAAALLAVVMFTPNPPAPAEIALSPTPAQQQPASFECLLVLSEESNYRVTLSGEEAQLVSLRFADGNQSSTLSFQSGEY
ncbi:MAG: hypothetical protein HY319_23470 [Armatimonadetes bacterium]|nr:hypothetical protein [Armatimonadota bacterium]